MRAFQEEMEEFRIQFHQQQQKKGWQSIQWVHQSNEGRAIEGEFRGQLEKGIPHGLGVWMDDGTRKIEAEWREGVLHGRAVEYQPKGRVESEMVEGKQHGKSIWFWSNGDRLLREFRHGKMEREELAVADEFSFYL